MHLVLLFTCYIAYVLETIEMIIMIWSPLFPDRFDVNFNSTVLQYRRENSPCFGEGVSRYLIPRTRSNVSMCLAWLFTCYLAYVHETVELIIMFWLPLSPVRFVANYYSTILQYRREHYHAFGKVLADITYHESGLMYPCILHDYLLVILLM